MMTMPNPQWHHALEAESTSFISDDLWQVLAPIFEPKAGGRGRPARNIRQQIEGMIFLTAAGKTWREMPTRFGKWNAIYHRYTCCVASGAFLHAVHRLTNAETHADGPAHSALVLLARHGALSAFAVD